VEIAFVPVGPRRTFEGAVEQIAERIRLGELDAGDRLPSERDLAASMQISRATLREAVHVLVDAGVLAVRTGSTGGIFVLSDYVPMELLRSKSDLRLEEVAGVLEARRLIEPRVAQLAAVHAREDDYASMQQTLDAQKALLARGDVLEH
jgi:GntR family transcriptional regulator, transcriptional repressor for pyruvate dehydrogenase complex